MSQSKLFDYNSSFSVIRTNPKLAGNFKITVDSAGGVWFNSMDVNPTLSDVRFKKFNITGENSYATDLYNYFDQGQISSSLIFQVGNVSGGSRQSAENFAGQYDFFYGSGASVLVDKNYSEDFKYFAPLWIKNDIPDFFVIFKVPGPLSYPYSTNVTQIQTGSRYKVIQDYNSAEPFVVSYGKDSSGADVYYRDSEIFTGDSNYSTYTIISGTGKVALFEELATLPQVEDIEQTFKSKILPNCSVVKTFDLRANTKIGKYIRSIFNNQQFSKSPLEVSWGADSYTYFRGVSYADGVFTKKGELLNSYLSSSKSDPMIDFEDYLTSGFSRNGIICPNLLNLEFLFNDDDSDLYTINRYMGFYVSRNDIAEFRSNGDFYYTYSNLDGNENYPQPTRNDFGYYYNNYSTVVSATSGVRLFYEDATGFLPGSDNVNLYDPNKLFYVTDKNENFYSLKRSEEYVSPGGNSPEYSYGPYDPLTYTFSATGSTGATSGTLVIANTQIDILNFTGADDKIATVPGSNATEAGRAYTQIEFLKDYDLNYPLTFKIFWPNGTHSEDGRKYDIVRSGDFSATLVWSAGSYYSSGNSYYFNASTGTTNQIATALANVLNDVDKTTWETGSDLGSCVIRTKNPGVFGNTAYSVSVFDNYDNFISIYRGTWSNTKAYGIGDVVLYDDYYYSSNTVIPAASSTSFNPAPGGTAWSLYSTFFNSGYVKINGIDASDLKKNVKFTGGTDSPNNRIIFSQQYSDIVKEGYFINTTSGKSRIKEVTRYVDDPKKDPATQKVVGFNNFSYLSVANLEDVYAVVDLGSDKSFNVYSSAKLNLGVFTFFDVKEFDFDFWSSEYGYSPTPETYRYFQLQENTDGVISPNVPYLVKTGQIIYNSVVYNEGDIFYGATGYSSFVGTNTSAGLNKTVVFPAQYSDITYDSSATSYSNIGYYKDLDAFPGFLGIQSMDAEPLGASPTKEEIFNHGKLLTEYQYLKENYTPERSNLSRIVPYINKWRYTSGVDARGNGYRLNSSPAFSPLNFSPSLTRVGSDPRYLTQEWFLLEQPPINFPKEFMNSQNSYLPYKIDLAKARSADPADELYLSSYFTVEPSDYPAEFRDDRFYTKELFTALNYNPASRYYETIFRGIKVVFKKRSQLTTGESNPLDKYIPDYRGYEDYKFSAILRAVPEDTTGLQPPVKYEVIENAQQKFILFVCDVVIKDSRIFELGYTGGTGGDPILDYTALYSLSDKTVLNSPLASGQTFTSLDDIKLSASLDLSLSSGSSVNTTSAGRIYISPNPEYETDLREEVHTYFEPIASGATSGLSSTGIGSFSVPSINCTYPWPIGVGTTYLNFGAVATGPGYVFSIPFSVSDPVTVPVGPSSVYKNKPVFQIQGGERYYSSILARCSSSYISYKVNSSSPYINYISYSWDGTSTVSKVNNFEIYMESPTKIVKPTGTSVYKSYAGPQELRGSSTVTNYVLDQSNRNMPAILMRYSGGYEPIFRKVIHFDSDKTDSIFGSDGIDLSFRNCNFAPNKLYFGVSRNLSYTKVSLGTPILSASASLPEGSVYPLVGQSPIAIKDFNLFSSTWDAGYYNKYLTATNQTPVAGTRSMAEYNTFFGSKVMQTPDPIRIPNYITLEISRTQGTSDVSVINDEIFSYIKSVQEIGTSNSGTGIGSVGPYLSGVDYNKLDLSIFPNAEVIWQYFEETGKIQGILRLDRIIRRYLLNSGIKQVFIDNMISDFGVGDPNSINDDINNYIELNIVPIYEGTTFDLFVKKSGNQIVPKSEAVRGDIFKSDRYKLGFYPNTNYQLTKSNALVYSFEYSMEANYSYSLLFDFVISKI